MSEFERVTVILTAASSTALTRAAEITGDSKTDTINRAIQTYAMQVGVVADGGRVLIQHAADGTESTQAAPMPEQQLAAIIVREANATKGPWHVVIDAEGLTRWVSAEDGTLDINFGYVGNRTENDALFVAYARTDVPALLADITRLRTELAEVKAHHAHVMGAAAKRVAKTTELRKRVAELETAAEKVAEFVAGRAEVITAIRNCHPDNTHDYQRWQGHAEARRVLAETLGLPIAWPAEAGDQPC
jgi:putative Ca2+/H+ antiporter (TMEM165/GDT1 family)